LSGFYPYNHRLEQEIQTDVTGVTADRAFVAHVNWADPAAASSDAIKTITLGAAAQTITTGITNPDYPRALAVAGNAADIAGNVVIAGTNYAGEAITDTIALDGTTSKPGTKAFKTVTSITVPAQTHTPAQQVETATIVGTITTEGTATVTVTSALYEGPVVMHVPVAVDDDASAVAEKIRAYIGPILADEFTVSGEGASVVLTAVAPAANDDTLNIAFTNGTCEGLTPDATSDNTTPGVAADTVTIGTTDILGLPYKLAHNTVLEAYLNNAKEAVAPTVTVSTSAVESNTVDLNSALNGSAVDVYLIV
jgi:hypothetical protein